MRNLCIVYFLRLLSLQYFLLLQLNNDFHIKNFNFNILFERNHNLVPHFLSIEKFHHFLFFWRFPNCFIVSKHFKQRSSWRMICINWYRNSCFSETMSNAIVARLIYFPFTITLITWIIKKLTNSMEAQYNPLLTGFWYKLWAFLETLTSFYKFLKTLKTKSYWKFGKCFLLLPD